MRKSRQRGARSEDGKRSGSGEREGKRNEEAGYFATGKGGDGDGI